jgi:predicted RNA binding protein YcfA (HicA-like mRNA interferase family)
MGKSAVLLKGDDTNTTKKISKKEILKLKKLEKSKKKQELEKLITKHTKECSAFLEDAYIEVISNLEDANNQLLNMSNYLSEEKVKIQKAIKVNDIELAEELIENSTDITDDFILSFSKLIRPAERDSVATPLVKAGQQANDYLNTLIRNLEKNGHKNALYIAQIIMNKVKDKGSEYANMTCHDFYVENPYLDMFAGALRDYTDYIKSLTDLGYSDIEIEEVEIENKRLKKLVSNSRLRCTHTDMMNFAKAMGYEENRQTNTTHRIWKNKETGISLPIPAKGNRTLPQGTMSRMLKQMNLTRKDLAKFLGK